MRRFVILVIVFVCLAAPERASSAGVEFQLLDWQPGSDATLQQEIAHFFHLDLGRLPHLAILPEGGTELVNPGGAPIAAMWAPIQFDTLRHPAAYTLRFEARGDGPSGSPGATAQFLTERLDFPTRPTWDRCGLTVQIPGPVGPGAIAFTLRAREGRLDIRGLQIIRLPFLAHARLAGDALRVDLTGPAPAGAKLQVAAVAPADWQSAAAWPGIERAVPVEADEVACPLPPGPGPRLIRWRLVDAGGTPIHYGGELLTGTVPVAPRGPVRRDVTIHADGQMRVEGRPFFPIGLYAHETSAAVVDAAKAAGLNLLLMAPAPDMADVVEAARKAGVEIVIESGIPSTPAAVEANVAERARALDGLPFLAWTLVDEPDGQPAFQPLMDRIYHAMAAADARPVYQSNHSPASFGGLGNDTDILAVDPYPVATVPKPLYTVAAWMDHARDVLSPGRSLWYIQQAFAEAPLWSRPPTVSEMRATTWMAINHGARGIVYYALHEILNPAAADHAWDLRETALWPEIAAEAQQIRSVETWLTTAPGPTAREVEGPIDAAAWTAPAGKLLIAVNACDQAVVGSVDVRGLGPLRALPFSAAPVGTRRGGQMRLELPAYGVAAYITGPASGGTSPGSVK